MWRHEEYPAQSFFITDYGLARGRERHGMVVDFLLKAREDSSVAGGPDMARPTLRKPLCKAVLEISLLLPNETRPEAAAGSRVE